MKNLIIASRDHQLFKEEFERHDTLSQYYKLIVANSAVDKGFCQHAQVLLGEPDILASIVPNCPELEWAQSTWAGNNKLQNLAKKDYALSGVKGVFGMQMIEYVLSYLLLFSRRIEDFNTLKEKRKWSQLPCQTLSSKSVGIMGLGSIGRELALYLRQFGMQVYGLSRTKKDIENIEHYHFSELPLFLSKCDIVISILPETNDTTGLCDEQFFALMREKSTFINVGRGSLIDKPSSLIDAINSGHLSGAVLDVFEQEPLLQNHPYYETNNVYISCHTAAISKPDKVFEVFAKNALNFVNKRPLLYQHDFIKGY